MKNKTIIFCALFFFGIDAIVMASHFFLGERIHFFEIDREGNLASLIAGTKLWAIGTMTLMAGLIFFQLKRARAKVGVWILASLGFFWIGLDDMMGIHERIGFVLNNMFERGGFYGESFNWLIYYSPLAIAGFIVIGSLIFDIWKENRMSAVLASSGLMLWVTSLCFEIIGRWILTSPVVNTSLYHSILVGEELFEMMGADFFLLSILFYFAHIVRAHVVFR